MAYLTEKQFDFRSSALPEDTFGVVDFKGFEGFSKPYEFQIMLVSSDPEIDLTEVLQNPAVFTILREEGDIPFNGILAQFEQLHAVVDHVFYRAVLVPRFWWLSLTHHNQIFLDKTVPEIIGEVLEDGGLTTDDYELRISNDYPKWEYICQYRESHQSFVSRWMEREGMYYFFEQTEKGEKLIITDSNMSHTPMAEGKTMYYSPPSGLEEAHREEVIRAVVCKQKLLPAKLHVNDYNYRKPSLSLSVEAEVLDRGRGDVHLYGEHFRTPEEGQELARIRAEELLCREKRFHGESTIPFLRTGYLFELQNHYRESFNQQYLTIELEHEGSQVGYLLAGIQEGLAKVEEQPYYRNSFVTIPSEVQYRHPKTTEKPTFNGTINARIDGEGSGQYAELDDQGRYKVRLPFDNNDEHKDGKASHWLRMAQPYAGENQGMHFPLHKYTEVLLTFIEGDPDRPIIAGAVPNPENASPVTSANQTKSVIGTGKGPETHSVGAKYVKSRNRRAGYASRVDNYIEFEDNDNEEHIRINSIGDLWLEANDRYGDYHVGQPEPGDTPVRDNNTDPPKIGNMLDKFGTGIERETGDPKPYNPTGLQSRHGGAPQTFDDAFRDGHVHVSSFDTINTQEGNVYDFGGYWVYNLGNCYVENHIDQGNTVTLNHSWDQDLSIAGGAGGPNKDIKCNDLDLLGGITEPRFEWIWELEGADFHNSAAVPTFSKTLDSGKTWVEKTLGGAKYNYTKGTQTLNVEVGTAEETHIYGRGSYEYKYSKGKLVSKTASKGGHSEEWKYDRVTGVILSHEKKDWLGVGGVVLSSSFSMGQKIYTDISIANKTHADISLAGDEYFKFNAVLKIGAEIKVGGEQNFSYFGGYKGNFQISTAVETDIKVNGALFFKFSAGIGAGFDFENKPTVLKFNTKSKSFKWEGPFTEASKKAAIKADLEKLALRKATTDMGILDVLVAKNNLEVKAKKLGINTSTIDIFT